MGIPWRQAGPHLFLLPEFKVQTYLFLEVRIKLAASN